MKNISGYPYFEIQFTKDGAVFNPQEPDQLFQSVGEQHITDLIVISHGWNNDMDEARSLYQNLIAQIAEQQHSLGLSAFSFGVLGVLWPSKKFADKDLIAGGAASISGMESPGQAALLRQLQQLDGFFDKSNSDNLLQKAKDAARKMAHDSDAANQFVQHLNALITSSVQSHHDNVKEDGVKSFPASDGKAFLIGLEDDWMNAPAHSTGGASDLRTSGNVSTQGSAAGLNFSFSDIFSGARNLLNFVTYYQMKERAGNIGSGSLYPLLVKLRLQYPAVRLHLIGHSFGGRLVTAAVAGPDDNAALQVDTLQLLQAAFSHYGFAEKYDGTNNGYFRRVVTGKKVIGPVVITYTHNDKAVGIAYALASRIAKQVGLAIGDNKDIYGGMGGNGAQLTPEANNDIKINGESVYPLKKGILYNINADACITSHSDICKKEVANVILSAIYYQA